MNKRSFLKSLTMAGLAAPLSGKAMQQWVNKFDALSAADLAGNEDFWAGIRSGYKLKPEYINLENGYYNFLPESLLEDFIGHAREVNYQGSYYMRTVQFDNKKNIAVRLAAMAGCSAAELIITRNTTESLDLVIGGLH